MKAELLDILFGGERKGEEEEGGEEGEEEAGDGRVYKGSEHGKVSPLAVSEMTN